MVVLWIILAVVSNCEVQMRTGEILVIDTLVLR